MNKSLSVRISEILDKLEINNGERRRFVEEILREAFLSYGEAMYEDGRLDRACADMKGN